MGFFSHRGKIYGRNAVEEALRSGATVDRLLGRPEGADMDLITYVADRKGHGSYLFH